MKGIRELAMSPEPTIPTRSYRLGAPYASELDDYDDYGSYNPPLPKYDNDTNFDNSSYLNESVRTDTFTITMQISVLEIGRIADDTLPEYDYNKACIKAEEIAYDRLEKLLGTNYESEYTISFSSYEGWTTWEVTVTLTPNAKHETP